VDGDADTTVNGNNNNNDATGLSVIGLQSKPDLDLTDAEFSDILSEIRQCGQDAIHLRLQKVVERGCDDHHHDHHNQPNAQSTSTTEEKRDGKHNETDDGNNTNENNSKAKSAYSSWSAWGSRMRAQSGKLAEQANKAAQLAKERAQQQLATVTLDLPAVSNANGAAATSSSSTSQSAKQQQQQPQLPDPQIFMQSNLGAFFPIDAQTSRNSFKLTTSSLLVARLSATEPCPVHYKYQWYQSSCGTPPVAIPLVALDDSSSIRSSGGNVSLASSKGSAATQPSATGHQQWIKLQGATNAAFQPNASLIGYRLRCVIRIPDDDSDSTKAIDKNDKKDVVTASNHPPVVSNGVANENDNTINNDETDDSDLDDDDDDVDNCSNASSDDTTDGGDRDHNDDSDDEMEEKPGRQIVCDDLPKVSADMTLFNAARQALARGARFGGLKGRGNATGRTFGLEIKMAAHPTRRGRQRSTGSGIVASVLISQVVSGQVEPLSNKPLLQATAVADSVQSKHLDLVLPLFRADGTSAVANAEMVQALCTDGKFQLEAPNRMTRESILLALGIANFGGKPSQLNASTILFPELGSKSPETHTVAAHKSLLDDEASCLTTSSGASSAVLSTSGLVPSTPPKSIHASTTSSSSNSAAVFVSSSASIGGGIPRATSIHQRQSSLSSTTTGHASLPLPPPSAMHLSQMHDPAIQERMRQMEEELAFLQSKLARKDKVVSEMQRRLTTVDASWEHTKQELSTCQTNLKQSQAEVSRLNHENHQLRAKEQAHEADLMRRQAEHDMKIAELQDVIQQQSTELVTSRKSQKSLQNDKAVLQAAVEARETKLSKMQTLQNSFKALEEKVGQHEHLKKELEMAHNRSGQIKADLDRVLHLETDVREQLHMAQQTVDQLNERLQASDKENARLTQEMKSMKDKHHTLKMERNNFKAKGDSLTKEISKLCRHGRTLKDIERIVANEESRVEEVEVLRKQKRQALEDAHEYRTSYEQSKIVTQQLQQYGANSDLTNKAIERSAELERLLAEMTEYVNAKEMQLETMKQVNEALQDEIHVLAKANMMKNDV